MDDESDPVIEAVTALRAAAIAVWPIGDELEHWQIADLFCSDADVWRLAASRGLEEGDESRKPGAMPTEPPAPVCGRQLAAHRTYLLQPGAVRHKMQANNL